MKSYEFSRFFHPKLGRFIYRHKGTGLIVDNIFKPIRTVASAVFSKFAKPVAKKALQSGISHAGDKLGKKAASVASRGAEKSGDFIMKKLGNMGKAKQSASKPKAPAPRSGPEGSRAQGESSAEILNRLISGQGAKRVKRNKRI